MIKMSTDLKNLILLGGRYRKENFVTDQVKFYENPKIYDFYSIDNKKFYSLEANTVRKGNLEPLNAYNVQFNTDYNIQTIEKSTIKRDIHFGVINDVFPIISSEIKSKGIIKNTGRVTKISDCLVYSFRGPFEMPHWVTNHVNQLYDSSFGLEYQYNDEKRIHLNIFPETLILKSYPKDNYDFSQLQEKLKTEKISNTYSLLKTTGLSPFRNIGRDEYIKVSKKSELSETFLKKDVSFLGQVVKKIKNTYYINVSVLIINKKIKIAKSKSLNTYLVN